jgi:2,5-dihydroxypyridine 5,6-dioxygenase
LNHLPGHWIDMFVEVFRLCGVKQGDACAVLSETLTRPELPQLSMLVLPARKLTAPVPVRSTGASDAIAQSKPVIQALASCVFVADCTVEGLQHAAELPLILAGGARVLAISHEHPEILERCLPRAEDELPVRDAMRRLKAAREMRVSSDAGTALRIKLAGAQIGGVWGYTAKPGTLSHWPGGLVLAFPAAGSVNGTLLLDRGDVNLTFKRYLQEPVRLVIENDHAVAVEGSGVDAEMTRGYLQAWDERAAYAVSHVGWGLNRRAARCR